MIQLPESLEQQLLNAGLGLSDDDFATHYSSLYVLAKPGVGEWLKANYVHWGNVTMFTSNPDSEWDGQRAYDIPFANQSFWDRVETRPSERLPSTQTTQP